MKISYKHLIFSCFLAISLALPAQPVMAGKVLKIAVTTDVHGSYFPNDWYDGKPTGGSLAQVSTWVREQRETKGQDLILLDNGDLIQGDPASYYSNFIDRGHPNIAARILNFMGYSAATVGNHDIEAGPAVYNKLEREFRFPWMAANAIRTATGAPWFKPYAIIEKQGLKIAVIGLITPGVPDWLPPALWRGMEFRDMIQTARQWSKFVREKEKPDLLIGLFHSGADASYGQPRADQPLNENASRLVAEQVPGFNIIFAGHDHRTWDLLIAGPGGDTVLLLGSRSRAVQIAVATITNPEAVRKGGKPVISGTHVPMGDYPPDPAFMSQFGGFIDSVQRYVDQPVGTITHAITSDNAWTGPSEFVSLIHRAQLGLTGAQISFTAPLSFRATIPAGTITIKDLFKLYRYENQLYTITLTGKEILGYLNYSYSLWMNTMTGPGDPMLNMQQQSDGTWRLKNAYYNFDSAAGIDYVVDLRKRAGEMVTITGLSDGTPFDPGKTYSVALNSYRASGGGGHLSRGAGLSKEEVAGRVVNRSDMDFRYLLAGWIQKQGTVNPTSYHNWKVIPENWIREAAPRDTKRLLSQN
jgi:2',3'-cyclic-nucleotide 2'-phosphodiesterase/3'-nucleotidase